MAIKRLAGQKNYLYFGTRGAAKTTGALTANSWYKISAKGAASALPATAIAGDVFRALSAITLTTGDSVIPIALEKAAFVTNVPGGKSKEKFENTVQTDDDKSYVEGDKSEKTGTINGYFFVGTDQVKKILSRFYRIADYAGTAVVFSSPQIGVIDFFLSRNETTESGDTEVWEYMPAIIDSITVDKPMEGNQTLDFSYTGIGSERPSMHYIPITTGA
jgi:hypothetical protein